MACSLGAGVGCASLGPGDPECMNQVWASHVLWGMQKLVFCAPRPCTYRSSPRLLHQTHQRTAPCSPGLQLSSGAACEHRSLRGSSRSNPGAQLQRSHHQAPPSAKDARRAAPTGHCECGPRLHCHAAPGARLPSAAPAQRRLAAAETQHAVSAAMDCRSRALGTLGFKCRKSVLQQGRLMPPVSQESAAAGALPSSALPSHQPAAAAAT